MSKIKKAFKVIGLFLLDKWFDITISGGSVAGTYKAIIQGIPDMNIFYVWLICWVVGLVTFIALSFRNKSKKESNELEEIIGKNFANQTISLDGKCFVNCNFQYCTFEFGDGFFHLDNCNIDINCRAMPLTKKVAVLFFFGMCYGRKYNESWGENSSYRQVWKNE